MRIASVLLFAVAVVQHEELKALKDLEARPDAGATLYIEEMLVA